MVISKLKIREVNIILENSSSQIKSVKKFKGGF